MRSEDYRLWLVCLDTASLIKPMVSAPQHAQIFIETEYPINASFKSYDFNTVKPYFIVEPSKDYKTAI